MSSSTPQKHTSSIVFVALGSLGDALPLCVVALALRQRHDSVKSCAVIVSSDVDLRALYALLPATDGASLAVSSSVASIPSDGDHGLDAALDDLATLASAFSPDLMCFNLWSVAAAHVAEALDCQVAVCSPAPAPAYGSIGAEHYRAIARALRSGVPSTIEGSGALPIPESVASYANFWMAPLLAPCYASWRAARGLPTIPALFPAISAGAPLPPVLLGYDSLILPPPGWWPREVNVCGSWLWGRRQGTSCAVERSSSLCPALRCALGFEGTAATAAGPSLPRVLVDLGSVTRAWARRHVVASAATPPRDAVGAAEDDLMLFIGRSIARTVAGIAVLRLPAPLATLGAAQEPLPVLRTAGTKRTRDTSTATSVPGGGETPTVKYPCRCTLFAPLVTSPATASCAVGCDPPASLFLSCADRGVRDDKECTALPLTTSVVYGHDPLPGSLLVVPHAFSHRDALRCQWRAPAPSSSQDAGSLPAPAPRPPQRAVAAFVHHGGAGTSATAAAAGVPQVVLSLAFDQPMWAARLEALAVAPAAPRLAAGCGAVAAAAAVAALVREVAVERQDEYCRAAGALRDSLAEAAAAAAPASDAALGAGGSGEAAALPAEGCEPEAEEVEFTPGTALACQALMSLLEGAPGRAGH